MDFSNDSSKSFRSISLPAEFGKLDIGASRKRGRLERSEEALRPELEDNFEHLLESNGGSKVKSLSIQQYENCTRYKDWLRLREEDEGAHCYLDDDAFVI